MVRYHAMRNRFETFLLIRCLLLGVGGMLVVTLSAAAQPASGPWTLEQCLEYGLKHHPAIRSADAAVNASRARIGSTRSGMGTKVSIQSNFTRNRQEFRRAGISGSNDLTDSTSNGISVRKTLTDSGQTSAKLNAANMDFSASRAGRSWNDVTTAVTIKTVYYKALQAMAQVGVQENLLQSYEVHLNKVRGFVDVGTRAPYDITKALVDVANTKVSVIKAQSEARNMMSELAKAVGYEGFIEVASQPDFLKLIQPELDSERLIEEALSRPDIAQIKFQVDAANHRLTGTKRGLNPTLSSTAGYDWSGTASPLDRSWSVGMQLSVPVLDGKLNKYSVEEQRNSLEQTRSTLDQQRLSVRAEVETAVTGVRDAFQRLEASEILLKQAAESLSLAEGRFDAGLGSPIEITDARAAFSSARGSHITAYYDSLIALTALDRSLGLMPAEAGGLSPWTTGAVTDETISESEIASITTDLNYPSTGTTGIATPGSGTAELDGKSATNSSDSAAVSATPAAPEANHEVKK